MYKNIVFDMGQTLLHWTPDYLMDKAGITDEKDRQILKDELFCTVEWQMLDRGTLLPEEGAKVCSKRIPEHLHADVMRFTRDWWTDYFYPMEGMDEIVRDLKARGYTLYILSNAQSALSENEPKLPGADCFTGWMASADVKLLKPEHEIYELFYDKFGIDPKESVFIDDSHANCEASERTGMKSIIFHGDAERLRRDLERVLGIEL